MLIIFIMFIIIISIIILLIIFICMIVANFGLSSSFFNQIKPIKIFKIKRQRDWVLIVCFFGKQRNPSVQNFLTNSITLVWKQYLLVFSMEFD